MDWKSCKKNKLVKDIKPDKNLIISLTSVSAKKLKSQSMLTLTEETASSKITLAYDGLRELLEALAVKNGYKIYNHECYCAFLKEIVNNALIGDKFDNFRKIRNNINYYGKDLTKEEAKLFLKEILELIEKIKLMLEE